jgi:ABC-type antimicrobial peptide transport system permease subunit
VEDDLAEMGSRFRATASFALFFGASAFALALIGLYGVMAFAVSRRRREMGIRLALGATRANIVQEVLRSGLRPVFYGIGAGLPLAGAFAFGLQYAFRMTPTPFRAADPMAFLPITLLLVAGSLAAMLKPALRACSANPADSLRQD